MQITLDAEDISLALKAYLVDMGINLDGKSVTTDFIAGRGVNGHKATLTISRGNTPTTPKADSTQSSESPFVETTDEMSDDDVDTTDSPLVFEED